MARGIGKTILAAAKLLSNPVGAVASVFRKKKGLKRGPTVASAGMVRRKYKGRSSGARIVQRNDGNGNLRMAQSHGRQPRPLNRGMESKIRDMLNPANHHVIQNSGYTDVANGKCVYSVFEMMHGDDVDEVIAQASGGSSSGILQKYNGKLNIQNVKLQLTLRNQTTNLVNMRIYEYICRRDVPDAISTFPNVGPEVVGTTANVVANGFHYQNIANINNESLGGTLFQNPFFCSYYKILKVRNVQLGAGKCLNLSMAQNKAHTINPLIYNLTDGDALAGLTRGFIIQASGSLVGPLGKSQPTTGFVNYDWFCSRKYAWNQPYTGVARNTLTSDLPTSEAPQYHINEYVGTAQVQNEA